MGTSTTTSHAIGRGARAGLLIALVACRSRPATGPHGADEVVALGDVRVAIRTSRTASLFHAVDQISAWSPYCHPQYAKWAPSPDDKEASDALKRHAELRKATSSDAADLERAFYLDNGKGAPPEEKHLLHVLSYRFDAKLDRGDAQAKKLETALRKDAPAFTRLVKDVLAVVDVPPPRDPIPIVFVPSPGRAAAGGDTAGIAVVEVPEEGAARSAESAVAHELVLALVRPRASVLAEAAERCGRGLDATTEGEALAYAISEGLFAFGEPAGALERQRERTPAASPTGRFVRLAIAIRPVVKQMRDRPKHDALRTVLDATCEAAKDLEWSTADKP